MQIQMPIPHQSHIHRIRHQNNKIAKTSLIQGQKVLPLLRFLCPAVVGLRCRRTIAADDPPMIDHFARTNLLKRCRRPERSVGDLGAKVKCLKIFALPRGMRDGWALVRDQPPPLTNQSVYPKYPSPDPRRRG